MTTDLDAAARSCRVKVYRVTLAAGRFCGLLPDFERAVYAIAPMLRSRHSDVRSPLVGRASSTFRHNPTMTEADDLRLREELALG